jgi:hypothetical protein
MPARFTFLVGTVACALLAVPRDLGFELVSLNPLDERQERP